MHTGTVGRIARNRQVRDIQRQRWRCACRQSSLLDASMYLSMERKPSFSADSTGHFCTDSLSVSHWRQGQRGLDPVLESDSAMGKDRVAAKASSKHLGNANTTDSLPSPTGSNDEAITVQLDTTFPSSLQPGSARAATPASSSLTVQRPPHVSHPNPSCTGTAGVASARTTCSSVGGGSASGGISGSGTALNPVAHLGNSGAMSFTPASGAAGALPTAHATHARHASTVSSVGASPEYEEDDLDEDWRMLLEEVNTLLASKSYSPIRNARCATHCASHISPRASRASCAFPLHERHHHRRRFKPLRPRTYGRVASCSLCMCGSRQWAQAAAALLTSSRQLGAAEECQRSEGAVPCRERATVVNSLLVSTSTRDRSECVRNAAIDMLTFRKMNGTTGSHPSAN
jgi:hypothetical protein